MLNSNIILAGQPLDLVGSMDRGTVAGQRFADARHQGQYRNALSEHGAGAMNGDQGAMNALASFDPAAMQNLQSGQLNMGIAQNAEARTSEMHPLRVQGAQVGIQQAIANLSETDRSASVAQLSSMAVRLSTITTPEQFDSLAVDLGFPEYVGRFAERDQIVGSIQESLTALNGAGGGGTQLPSGVIEAQWRAEQAGLTPGTPDYQSFILNGGGTPANFRSLDMQARASGYLPGTSEYENFMATRGAGEQAFARTTGANAGNVDNGGEAARVVAEGRAIGANDAVNTIALAEMERSMPGLRAIASRLSDLSNVATFGRAQVLADDARRALGQEVSAGGIARAEYIAIVDNEILPLLKQTFGAAFTEQEGARLRATLGNENGTPAERQATLAAFIEQKQRQLETMGGGVQQTNQGMSDQDLLNLYSGGQ